MTTKTESKIKQIMEPLKAAELKIKYKECQDCRGTGIVGYMVTRDESDAVPCDNCDANGFIPCGETNNGREVGL